MSLIKQKSSDKYVILIIVLLISGVLGYTVFSMIGKDNSTIVKTENGYRVDKEPIKNRFPKLGQFEKCYWKADTVGESGIGPSAYWMKGFVLLNSKDFDAFKAKYKWSNVENGWTPSLDANILKIQSFKWSYSREFDNYIKSSSYVGKFYLDFQNGIVFFDVQK